MNIQANMQLGVLVLGYTPYLNRDYHSTTIMGTMARQAITVTFLLIYRTEKKKPCIWRICPLPAGSLQVSSPLVQRPSDASKVPSAPWTGWVRTERVARAATPRGTAEKATPTVTLLQPIMAGIGIFLTRPLAKFSWLLVDTLKFSIRSVTSAPWKRIHDYKK